MNLYLNHYNSLPYSKNHLQIYKYIDDTIHKYTIYIIESTPLILGFCNATWDTVLCWPMTPGNTTALLPCPKNIKGIIDTRKYMISTF